MPLIPPIDIDTAAEDAQQAAEFHVREQGGSLTNMKRTLLHSPPAFLAYMEWYTLAKEIEPFIGKRGIYIFSHAISTQNDCLICSAFFRKILTDQGENPDELTLNEQEALLAAYGKLLASTPHAIPSDIHARLKAAFSDREIVLLTAFAGIMVATNLFNTALKVDLDEYLHGY